MRDEHVCGLTARFKLDDVADAKATVSLTATVSFWKEAAKALQGDGYGAWQVRAAIRNVIGQAEAAFYERIDDEGKKEG